MKNIVIAQLLAIINSIATIVCIFIQIVVTTVTSSKRYRNEKNTQLIPRSLSDTTCKDTTPLIFISGYLGFGSAVYWGDTTPLESRTKFFLHVGPASSAHDRAVEVFYKLKGGVIDYGEEHSCRFKHSRFGPMQSALYPNWSANNPIHILGHSYGGNTALYLYQLLEDGYFRERGFPESNGSWIRSITTLSSPLKGTHALNIGGIYQNDLLPLSLGWIKAKLFHLHAIVDPFRILESFWHLSHWNISRCLISCCKGLAGQSPFTNGIDVAPFNMTIEMTPTILRRFQQTEFETLPSRKNTYFISFANRCTKQLFHRFPFHYPIFADTDISSWPTAFLVGHYGPDSKWYENDGCVPSFSQCHPHMTCSKSMCRHVEKNIDKNNSNFNSDVLSPGVWCCYDLTAEGGISHSGIVPFPKFNDRQLSFYRHYNSLLKAADKLVDTISI